MSGAAKDPQVEPAVTSECLQAAQSKPGAKTAISEGVGAQDLVTDMLPGETQDNLFTCGADGYLAGTGLDRARGIGSLPDPGRPNQMMGLPPIGLTPEISVVMPTHRRPELLAQAIGSVLAQREPPLEIMVVDDADDDATRHVVAGLACSEQIPIRYVRNEQGGVCHSRNLGARESRGRWLAFLDDDDLWADTYLEQAACRLRQYPSDFVVSGLVRHQAGRLPAKRVQVAGLTSACILAHAASMTGSNLLIRRDAFFLVDGFDVEMTVFNDWDLLVRLVDAGLRYTVAPDAIAEWRDHAGLRIATPSRSRADGINRFLHRYGSRLSPSLKRNLETTALGIHRRHARSVAEWLILTGRLLAAHGPDQLRQRLIARLARRGLDTAWDREVAFRAGAQA